ncbi:hypothetical protein D3C81_904880 [compost metagenome]
MFKPRTDPPAPSPAMIMFLPRKPNFLTAFVFFSNPRFQSPKTCLMFLSSNISATSEIMFSARVAVADIIKMNWRLVKRTQYRMKSLTTVVLPKPRGNPSARSWKARSKSTCSLSQAQTAKKTGGQQYSKTSGIAKPAKKSGSCFASSATSSCANPASVNSDIFDLFFFFRDLLQ